VEDILLHAFPPKWIGVTKYEDRACRITLSGLCNFIFDSSEEDLEVIMSSAWIVVKSDMIPDAKIYGQVDRLK
jgi:hypothetical protein